MTRVLKVIGVVAFSIMATAAFAQSEHEPAVVCDEAAEPQLLRYGDHTEACAISAPAESDRFRFFGEQGDVVRIRFAGLSSLFDGRIEVREPTGGGLLVSDGCSAGSVPCSFAIVIDGLPVTGGPYEISVTDGGANDTGAYSLHLEKELPVSERQRLKYNEPLTRTLGFPSDSDLFSFEGAAATTIRIAVVGLSPLVDPQIIVWGPESSVVQDVIGCSAGSTPCSFAVDLPLSTMGSYQVGIYDAGADDTGTYQIGLQCLFGDCESCREDFHCEDGDDCTVDACTSGTCGYDAVVNCNEVAPETPIEGDLFGSALDYAAGRLIVGAPGETAGAGGAYIFDRVGEDLVERARLVDEEMGEAPAAMGSAVALSDDVAVVGAPAKPNDTALGSVLVFRFDGASSAWEREQELLPDDLSVTGAFGTSVAVGGDTIVVGAPEGGAGVAYVFRRAGAVWTQSQRLTPSDGRDGDAFGTSVGIDGGVIVVGSPSASAPGGCTTCGAVYVFEENVSHTYVEEIKLTAPDRNVDDAFGAAVDARGDVVLIGAPGNDERGANSGAAYVSVRIAGSWSTPERLPDEDDVRAGDRTGESVDMGDDALVVGAPGVAAYVYTADAITAGSTPWQRRRYQAPPESDGSFADDTAIGDADVFGGAPREDREGAIDAGVTYRRPRDFAPPPSCADTNQDEAVTATDALSVLRAAVGAVACDLCVCDADGSGSLGATDALLVLRVAVGQSGTLICCG